MTPRAKGSTVQGTLAYLRTHLGSRGVDAVLARLAPDDADRVRAATATEELPYALLVRLWTAADAQLTDGGEGVHGRNMPRDWADDAGQSAIGSLGVQLYGGILRKASPHDFLTQSISLFRLYYQPGDMEVVEATAGRAVLRLVGFDPVTPLFCRRLTGGLRAAVTVAGGEQARVQHVRCGIEGDAFCEWALQWQVDPPAAGARSAG
jgi:hypothetical protein